MNNGFEIVRVQEQPEYQELFDMGGLLGERVQELANQEYAARVEDDCADLITTLLEDYWKPRVTEGPKDWSPKAAKQVGQNGVVRLCEALKAGELPETESFIRGSTEFAWEKAFLPTDNDIRHALQDALNKVSHEYGLSDVWLPLLQDAEDEAAEVSNILNSLMHKVGGWVEHFQPYQIQFNFIMSQKVFELMWGSKRLDRKALNREFEYLRDAVMDAFWKILGKEMKADDPSSRVEWLKEWNEMLRDKLRVEAAQAEMLDYLKGRTYP